MEQITHVVANYTLLDIGADESDTLVLGADLAIKSGRIAVR